MSHHLSSSLALPAPARLRGATPRPVLDGPSEREVNHAASLAARSERALAHVVALGDKQLFFSASRESFVMYRKHRSQWIAMGDPVGPPSDAGQLLEAFVGAARREGVSPVFYQVAETYLVRYRALGLELMHVGEEALVPLQDFTMTGKRKARLRQTVRRTERDGGTFEVVPPEHVRDLLPSLRRISREWLERKQTREKGFSLGRFDERYIERFPVALVRKDGEPVAFSNLWMGAAGTEVAMDLTRYSARASYGAMEYMAVKSFEWAKECGYGEFSLGMAPLAGLENDPRGGWERLGGLVYGSAERFYNFRGVRTYKSKFDPEWAPRYVAMPAGWATLSTMLSLGLVIAGGFRGLLSR